MIKSNFLLSLIAAGTLAAKRRLSFGVRAFVLVGLIGLVSIANVNAANKYAVASGNWNASIWASTSTGAAGSTTAPAAGDAVYVNAGITLTINQNVSNSNTFTVYGNLLINSGVTLTLTGTSITFQGDFTNNGTFTINGANTSVDVTISGVNNQSISGFTTLGNISMTKTSGTATFTGNVTAVNLTLNGSGGTLSLGSSNHTLNGILTITNGSLKGGSSKITLTASGNVWTDPIAGFNPETSEVVFTNTTGSPAISVGGLSVTTTFNNLTLQCTGQKLMVDNKSTGIIVNNALSICSTCLMELEGGTATTLNKTKFLTIGSTNYDKGIYKASLSTNSTTTSTISNFSKSGSIEVSTGGSPNPPTISTSGSLNFFTTTYGSSSTAQGITINGTNLTQSITATAPTGFQVSRDSSTYKDTVIFAQSGGSVSGKVYIRLSATASVGTYNSQSISLTSTGATAVNITTSSSGNLVSAAALTITAKDTTKVYGQGITFSGSEFTTSGLKNGETIGSVTLTSSGSTATANVSGSPYTITPSAAIGGTFTAGNYSITYATSGKLTISAAALTIKAKDTTKVYDGLSFSGGNGVTYTGFVNSETSSVLGGTLSYSGTSQTAKNVGAYDITPSGLTSSNYNIIYNSGSLTIIAATPTLSVTNSPVTYTGSAQAATVSGSVAGSVTNVKYDGSSTVPTNAGTYAITADFTPSNSSYNSLTGASAGNFVINSATPTLSVTNSPVTYTGSAQAATVSGSVAGSVTNVKYDGSSTVPTNAGTYAITADFTPSNSSYNSLTGASAGNFVINSATPTLSVTNSPVTYTGSAQAATVSGSVAGSVTNVKYDGSSTVPTNAGTYAITADFTPSNSSYNSLTGASAGNFVINSATPTLSVTNSPVTYTGSAQAATVSGSVAGSVTNVKYDGSSTVPTNAGTYAITADFTPSNSSYNSLTGASAGNFVINSATPTLSVTNSPVTYTGSAQAATVSGSVAGSVTNVKYDGSSTVPTNAGTYAITADFTPSNSSYNSLTGASAGNFVINSATPTLSVTNSPVTYTGSAQAATVSGSVAGSVTNVKYDGSSTVPTNAGTYAITADFTPSNSSYNSLTGASAGNFVINSATPTLSVTNSPVTYTGSAQAATVSGSVAGSVTNVKYDGSSTVPTNAGTYAITADFTPSNSSYNSLTGASAGNFVINQKSLTITARSDTKIYGQTKTYGVGSTAFTYSGLQNSETIGTVTIATSGGTAADDAAGNIYTLTPSSATGGTFTASNYNITYSTGTLTITAKSITGTFSTTDKIYDGTTSATVSARALSGVLDADVNDVLLTGGTATFANAEIGENKTVTLTGATLTGSKASNYTLSSVATTTATIRSGSTASYTLNQPADITAGARAAYTVTRKDASNNLAITGNETVYLSANNTGAKFYDAASGGNEIASVQIAAGQSTANFWFRDTIANTYIITVSDKNPADGNTGVADATDEIIVNAASAVGMKLSGPTSGTSNIAVENITATVVDEFGNNAALANNPYTRFQLTTTAANASFDSSVVRLAQGTTSYTFKYTSPLAGLNTINMKWLTGETNTVNASKTVGTHDVTISAGPAAKLTIRTQPVGDSSGKLLKTQPVIEIQDAQGNLTSSNATVTVAIKSGSNGSIGGTKSINAVSGVVSYNDLTLSGVSSEDYTLEFSAPGLTSAQSNSNIISSATVKLAPGVSKKIIFTNAAKTLTAAKASDAYTIQLIDANENYTNSNQSLEIDLSTSATSTGTFLAANKDSVITHAIINAGSGSASFRYKDNKVGIPTLSVANLGLTGDAQQQTVNAGTAKKLVFTSAAQTITAGKTSSAINVQMQDSTGNEVKASVDGFALNLSSNGNYKFFDLSSNVINSIVIPANSSTANFTYTDNKSGIKQLVVSTTQTGIQSATQNITVKPREAYATVIKDLTPADPILGLNHGIVKIVLVDTFGNTTTASLTTFFELKLKINGVDASSKFDRYDGDNNLPLVQSFAIGDSMQTINYLRFNQATTTHTSTSKGYANLYTSRISGMALRDGESDSFEIVEGHIYQPKVSGKWTDVQWEVSNDLGRTFNITPVKTSFETDDIVQIPSGILTEMNASVNVYSLIIDGILDVTKGNTLTLYHTNKDLLDYNIHVHGTFINSGGEYVNTQPIYKINFHGGTYQHDKNGGSIPAANWTTLTSSTVNGKLSKLYVTGLKDSVLSSGLDQAFQDVEWDNISQTAKQQLNGNITVAGKLSMTAGILKADNKQILVLGSIEGGSKKSYVEGKLTYASTTLGNKKFPIGNAAGYMPVVIDYTELSDSSIITAEAINSDLTTTLSSELVKVGSRYWKLDEGKSSTNKKFNLSIGRDGLTLADTPFVVQVVNGDVKTQKSNLITDYIVTNDYTEGGEFAIATVNLVAPKISGVIDGCIGSSVTLSASTLPASTNAWKSLDANIATVDSKGVVTGVKAGTVKIVYTDYRKLTDTFAYTVKPSPSIIAPVNGECIIAPNVARTYYVNKTADATSFKWTLPTGWTSNGSTTDTIKVTANGQSGILTVVPYNGTCEGNGQSLNIGVIDLNKVTITSGIATVLGDSIMSSTITMKMPTVLDVNGSKIACDNYNITFLTNNGGFSNITKVNDTTFTAVIRAFAGESLVKVRIGGGVAPATAAINFSGPQGSMNVVSNPIIKGESPKLKFNFSEGIAPFTVIYRTSDTAKVYDTITNVLDGGEYASKPLMSSSRFKMMSIIAANGARRTTNFTKDTANISVLEPGVQVILEATKPTPQPDNTYSTTLGITVENTGQVDLTTIQINADLTSVFPPPTQFIVDSITFNGETVKLNSNFDGTTNTNLFAWNELPSKKLITRKYTVYESVAVHASGGIATEGEVSFNGQSEINRQADNYVLLPVEKEMQEEVDVELKRNMFFFATQSKLPIGKKGEVNIFMRLKPNGNKKPYVMQVAATGTATLDPNTPNAPVAVASAVSTDAAAAAALAAKKAAAADTSKKDTTAINISQEAGQPFVEVPTVITIIPDPVVGAALNISEPDKLSDESYDVKLSYKLKNYGNVTLKKLALFQRLSREIPSPAIYKIKSFKVNSGIVSFNSKFDGDLDSNMLAESSILPYADSATFEMVINVKPTDAESLFRLQGLARAVSADGDLFTIELSTNGENPDPSADEIPAEEVISRISINIPIKILKTGQIAIVDPFSSKDVKQLVYCDSTAAFTVRQISDNTGGYDKFTYRWESSTDGIAYSYYGVFDDSTVSIKGLTKTTYLRRKLISGDQWDYSEPVLITINKATKPVITASANALAVNGSVTLTSTDAKSYKWSTGETGKNISISAAGRYTLSIIDNNGCTAFADTAVIAPPVPASSKTTYILGAIDNPTTVAAAVKTTVSNASIKFYNKLNGGTKLALPNLPATVGTYQYFVAQDVDGIESSVVPIELTMLDPVGVVTIEKVLSKNPTLQSDASFLLGFDFNLANLRSEALTDINLVDDLSKVFPSKARVEVVSIKATGKLNPNTFYNGYAQTNLLAANSQISGNSKDTIQLLLRVYPNGFVGDLYNSAEQTVTSPFGTFKMRSYDAKQSGSLPVVAGAPTKFNVPEINIIIPTGFSPNRDGQNDVYVVVRPYNYTIGMEIFDRTGGLVYKAQDYQNNWDGKSNQRSAFFGRDLPDGTYFYVISATDKNTGKATKFNGYITLKR